MSFNLTFNFNFYVSEIFTYELGISIEIKQHN